MLSVVGPAGCGAALDLKVRRGRQLGEDHMTVGGDCGHLELILLPAALVVVAVARPWPVERDHAWRARRAGGAARGALGRRRGPCATGRRPLALRGSGGSGGSRGSGVSGGVGGRGEADGAAGPRRLGA